MMTETDWRTIKVALDRMDEDGEQYEDIGVMDADLQAARAKIGALLAATEEAAEPEDLTVLIHLNVPVRASRTENDNDVLDRAFAMVEAAGTSWRKEFVALAEIE